MKWVIFLFFLVSCIDQPVTEAFSTSDDSRDSLRSRVRRSLSDTSARCFESENCKSVCEDMYLKATDLDRCYDTSENRVKAVAEVFDVLINPDRLSDLNDIEVKDFAHFLNIGYRAFLDLIDRVHRDEDGDRRNTYWEDVHAYDYRSAQLVLEWIANEEKVARSISSKDKDSDIIRHLFCIAGRSISVNKQKDYMCDLWDIDCDHLSLDSKGKYAWIPSWKMNIKDNDDEVDCHDDPASLYIGITQGDYDDVAFSTYANDQENDQGKNLSDDLIDQICGINLLCKQFYKCPVKVKYEGYVIKATGDLECGLYKIAKDALGP